MDKLNETISKLEAWIDDQNAMDTEIDACIVADALELLKEQQAEIDRLEAEKTKAFDYLFSKFAGHSNYHGDSILCAIEAVKEGKEIKTVKTMDKAGEQE